MTQPTNKIACIHYSLLRQTNRRTYYSRTTIIGGLDDFSEGGGVVSLDV